MSEHHATAMDSTLADMRTVESSKAPAESPARTHFRALMISSDTYPPTRVDVTVLFGEEMGSRGHRVDMLLQSEGACERARTELWGAGALWVGPTDLGGSLVHRLRKHFLGIAHDLKVFRLARDGDYDIIEVKDKFVSGLFAVMAARRSGIRFVYWLSYPFPEAYLASARDGTARYPFLALLRGLAFKFLLYRVLLPRADHVFVQSEQMRRDVAAEGVEPSKMTAVPMGIRLGSVSLAETLARTVIPSGERCFLYLGTLIKMRRLDFLVRVLAEVQRVIPDAKLYFVGNGEDPSDEQVLIDEARRLNVSSSVVLTGRLPQPQALKYVQDADVCASPFYPTPILNSTSPTKLVEYMAMGKAVVANHHPEQDLLIRESGAGYAVPYREQDFAEAIVSLMQQPEQARAMGARGRQYVESHRSYRVIADGVEREFLRIAGLDRRTGQTV